MHNPDIRYIQVQYYGDSVVGESFCVIWNDSEIILHVTFVGERCETKIHVCEYYYINICTIAIFHACLMAMLIIILRNKLNVLQLFNIKLKWKIPKKVIISSVQKKNLLPIEFYITKICVLKARHMICIKKREFKSNCIIIIF